MLSSYPSQKPSRISAAVIILTHRFCLFYVFFPWLCVRSCCEEMQVFSCDKHMFLHKKNRDSSRLSCGAAFVDPQLLCGHDKVSSIDRYLTSLLPDRDQSTAPETVRASSAVFTACGTCSIFAEGNIFGSLFGSGPEPPQALVCETAPSRIIGAPSLVYCSISAD